MYIIRKHKLVELHDSLSGVHTVQSSQSSQGLLYRAIGVVATGALGGPRRSYRCTRKWSLSAGYGSIVVVLGRLIDRVPNLDINPRPTYKNNIVPIGF